MTKYIRPFKRRVVKLIELPPVPKLEFYGTAEEYTKALDDYIQSIKARNEQIRKIAIAEREVKEGREQMKLMRPSALDKLERFVRRKSALQQSREGSKN